MRLDRWDGGFRADAESAGERQMLDMFFRALVALQGEVVETRRYDSWSEPREASTREPRRERQKAC